LSKVSTKNKNKMKKNSMLLIIALLLSVYELKAQNYVHTISNVAYQDLVNPGFINNSDSIASAYYVNANLLFPAFGAHADFNTVSSVPSLGAYVTRNGYVAVYEKPAYNYTYVFHSYFANLLKINATSAMSVIVIPNGTNKILKFQWKNMGLLNHSDTEYVNFQIWFDETNKSVSYHYGPSKVIADSNTGGVIGLLRAPNDFSSFTHATYFRGDSKSPSQLEIFHPKTYRNLEGANNFPPSGTLISFRLPTTSIKPTINNKFEYKVFPNPFNEKIEIDCEGNFEWQIFDMLGKLLKSGPGFKTIEINTADLNKGFYQIRIVSQGEIAVEKLVN
jgi:hypothetical protein